MAKNILFKIKPKDLIYSSCKEFMNIVYLFRSNIILNEFREKISEEVNVINNGKILFDGEDFFDKINNLNRYSFYKAESIIIINSNIIGKRIAFPSLSALTKSKKYIYIFSVLNDNQKYFEYRGIYRYQDELEIISSIFLMFYEIYKKKMLKKYQREYKFFIDKKKHKINNIYWGLAKIIRDCIAHNQSFNPSAGNGTFKIIENEEITFFGVKKKISDFKNKKVKEVFTSIDFMIILYYLEQELEK